MRPKDAIEIIRKGVNYMNFHEVSYSQMTAALDTLEEKLTSANNKSMADLRLGINWGYVAHERGMSLDAAFERLSVPRRSSIPAWH